MRGRISKLLLGRERAEKLLQDKSNLVIKMQSHFRRKLSVQHAGTLRKEKSALILQKYMRGIKVRKVAKRERDRNCSAILIQRAYRKRL